MQHEAAADAEPSSADGPRRVRPFLKWAGGKTQLLPQLRRFYPRAFGRYVEPFLGSGAVFLDLHSSGRLADHPTYLRDTNLDIIGCYRAIRDDVETVISELEQLESDHRKTGPRHFYEVRDGRFNPIRRRLLGRRARDPDRYPASLAAMLIYLNRTGFNGLFRLNASGGFNVPAGRYRNPLICDATNLRAVAHALSGPRRHISSGSYDHVLRVAREGDFVYLDPPYFPLTRTARFTTYTADGFGSDDHHRLQQVVIRLAGRGCHVLLSNSTAPEITRLYRDDPAVARAGLKVLTVPARRAINANAGGRHGVLEYIITNLPRRRQPGPS